MQPSPKPAVLWTRPPEFPTEPLIPILSPKPGVDVVAIITSEELVGAMTHYLFRRTRACTGVEDSCEGCLAGLPKRWKGYLAAVVPPKGHKVIVEITYEGYRSCEELHRINFKLRGKRIKIRRMGKSNNSRTQVMIEDNPHGGDPGEPFDLHAALVRIWFHHRGQKNATKEQRFKETMRKFTHEVGHVPED